MIWLLLSILCSASLMFIFKTFSKYEIDTFHAIVINYTTAVVLGLFFVTDLPFAINTFGSWFHWAIILGSLFITLFFLIGKTTQNLGISVTTVAMKLGYILPIILAYYFYKEAISSLQMLAIGLTLVAVVFSSIKKEESQHEKQAPWLFLLPIIIFLGSGICDAIVQYTEKTFFKTKGFEAFLIILFATAATLGFIAALIHDFKKKQNHFTQKNILAGIILGIPNYGSIYFLFKALSHYKDQSAQVFSLNNIGIVAFSSFMAFLLFKEKMTLFKILGLLLAILSIILMNFEQLF